MFDIILNDVNMGEISKIDGNVITISRETWAPGLWCGSENSTMKIGQTFHKIGKIDLSSREIEVDDTNGLKVGDEVRFGTEVKE